MTSRCLVSAPTLLVGVASLSFSLGAAEPTNAATAKGRLLAQTFCVTCHALPRPEQLDRRTWQEELLPKMSFVVGLEPPPTNYFRDLDQLVASNFFPKVPLIPRAAFDQIAAYYTNAAPEQLASLQTPGRISTNLTLFTPIPAKVRHQPPLTSLTRIDAQQKIILFGDATTQGIDFVTPTGDPIANIKLGNIPTSLCDRPDAYWFGCIGHFFPREEPRGQVLRLVKTSAGLRREVILSDLPRVSHVNVADLDGDGHEDFTLCAYGNYLGHFSWFSAQPQGGYTEHVLLPEPGCLRCEILDLNHDGKPDLAVLQAQARESFLLFLGDGHGGFEKKLIFQRAPSWGHTSFQFADFNGDGEPDLLVTNGDNADFNTSPPKPHHGVRIYLNRGNLKFEEAWFSPMNGAFAAVARDFDHDGDLDIAAISFFPDYLNTPRESFLYFENTGGKNQLEFAPSSFDQALTGRWITLDAGDMDGDGDDDLILGSLTAMPTPVPPGLKRLWDQSGPSLLILRNDAPPAKKAK